MTLPEMIDRAAALVRSARRQADADVEAAERRRTDAKRMVREAIRLTRAEPQNASYRVAADELADDVTHAGRQIEKVRALGAEKVAEAEQELESWRFEAAAEAWCDRATRVAARELDVTTMQYVSIPGAVPAGLIDESLMILAGGDEILAAALHLQRDGIKIPDGWRSPSGAVAHVPEHRHHDPAGPLAG